MNRLALDFVDLSSLFRLSTPWQCAYTMTCGFIGTDGSNKIKEKRIEIRIWIPPAWNFGKG